jgi:4-amino-4-deoxy-L-arabinose transferase-like glycosyltransferase
MGTATCYVVYLSATRVRDQRLGLVTAVFGATAYFHAMWSHYINVDIGMVLAMWIGILAYMEYERRNRKRWLVLAGVFCGVAFAFKFTGAVAIVPIAIAISLPLSKWNPPWRPIKEGLIVVLAMTVTTAVVAPENILGIGSVAGDFTALLENNEETRALSEEQEADLEFDSAVREVTVLKGPDYLSILMRPLNMLFTLLALVGVAIAVKKRYRWDLILSTTALIFLTVMSVADRPGEERYLLTIVPALWLLSARAVTELIADRRRLLIAACAVVIAVSLFPLVRQNVSWTLPDTRILAKDWIEANVAPDSKVLMDGMRYRFIQSPPLLPNETAVTRRIGGAASEERLSRGVSDRTLKLYASAMAQAKGPKFDLYSTVYGLGVKPLSYYPDHCFDYVVTSSQNSQRFSSPDQAAEYPLSAEFYTNISTHPRYNLVRSFHPAPWKIQGPAIDIYAVDSTCE